MQFGARPSSSHSHFRAFALLCSSSSILSNSLRCSCSILPTCSDFHPGRKPHLGPWCWCQWGGGWESPRYGSIWWNRAIVERRSLLVVSNGRHRANGGSCAGARVLIDQPVGEVRSLATWRATQLRSDHFHCLQFFLYKIWDVYSCRSCWL